MGVSDREVLQHAAMLAERRYDFETARRLREIAHKIEHTTVRPGIPTSAAERAERDFNEQ